MDGKRCYDVVRNKARSDRTIVNRRDWYGFVLETTRERVAVGEIERDARCSRSAIDERIRLERFAAREMKDGRHKEVIRRVWGGLDVSSELKSRTVNQCSNIRTVSRRYSRSLSAMTLRPALSALSICAYLHMVCAPVFTLARSLFVSSLIQRQ